MEKKNKKKLTIENLIEDNKKYKVTKQINVLDEYVLNIRPYMSAVDISNILKEFGEWIGDKNVQKLVGTTPVVTFLMCFIVKNQTDLFAYFTDNKSNIDLFNIFTVIINSWCLDEIISSIDKESLSLLYVKYDEIIKISDKLYDIERILNKNKKNENS